MLRATTLSVGVALLRWLEVVSEPRRFIISAVLTTAPSPVHRPKAL